ncbi:type II toxin-antitoxin system HipA family toxin [Rathayibacter rathayi]|uniref:type II toxin-antitoxin system HipA family toxin n=1 Tax=Rathayibacter rathayi TaxID=33887 RepID=UPI000CE7AE7D|nr:HipA domain-containing protein [Rathayibacter rathayi]PPF25674.1 phosphatidylinositol kinase [Rathayibacter rathayi]PPG72057.1 phosphatidylinositol kinase [Rathayibacter rathayi]PPG78881.1 phosphatidylinositol kinase [Rathayibacter rathayi]PPG95815.1 phosphatidylinositol kinase [Rathayibacter rathayi]PPG97756.1 phosphatidylinositol kinase [Rathayibacter rathayi]
MTAHDSLEVHVEIDGATVLAGRAQFHRGRGSLTSTTFQYEPDYLALPHSYALDPRLDLFVGTQQTPGVPGAFADSAPDRWGRTLIMKRERALARQESRTPRALDDVDFLTGVADTTRQGALRFRGSHQAAFLNPDDGVPRLPQLPALLRAAEAVTGDEDEFESVTLLLDAGTGSLGGARPKASVRDDNGDLLMAKFPHSGDQWDVMLWEGTALDLAFSAGVRVPEHRLIRVDGRRLLLLRRFDRRSRRGGRSDRVGYLSAMALLERRDGDGGDYLDLAERIPETSIRASDDARQLFRRAAVNVGLNNTDDHLRNHGFVREGPGWTLSPAFDINPEPEPARRQTSIAGADNGADQAEGLVVLAEQCRLAPGEFRAELLAVVEALSDWQDVARSNGARPGEITRFEESFETGLRTLREAAR